MLNVRIIEIPCVKAVYSGPLTDESVFNAFLSWFSSYHASIPGELYPRDFYRTNERLGADEWFYALPGGVIPEDTGGFPVVDLPHGLFAVAPCVDGALDGRVDWEKTRDELTAWAERSERFRPCQNAPGTQELYPMYHIVSPGRMIPGGLSIEDLYLPIEER